MTSFKNEHGVSKLHSMLKAMPLTKEILGMINAQRRGGLKKKKNKKHTICIVKLNLDLHV